MLFKHFIFILMFSSPLVAEAPLPQPAIPSQHLRVLPLQGGQNFRDLGGYRTTDGNIVRWGLLFRSGSMHFLTPADYRFLERLGIRTVCDFRDTHERASEPALWPPGKSPRILADDYWLTSADMGMISGRSVPTAAVARANMAALYPQILKKFNGQYQRMFGELLAGRAPLTFNCTAGKDRTGIAAALLLTTLGVPRKIVIQDYLLTNRYLDPGKVNGSGDQASGQWRNLPSEMRKAFILADPSYIDAVFYVMDSHAGGTMGYLREELGLTPESISKLRRMYTSR